MWNVLTRGITYSSLPVSKVNQSIIQISQSIIQYALLVWLDALNVPHHLQSARANPSIAAYAKHIELSDKRDSKL